MGDVVPLITALGVLFGGLGAAGAAARRLRGRPATPTNSAIAEERDLWKTKYGLMKTDFDNLQAEQAELKEDLEFERASGRQCRADLAAALRTVRAS